MFLRWSGCTCQKTTADEIFMCVRQGEGRGSGGVLLRSEGGQLQESEVLSYQGDGSHHSGAEKHVSTGGDPNPNKWCQCGAMVAAGARRAFPRASGSGVCLEACFTCCFRRFQRSFCSAPRQTGTRLRFDWSNIRIRSKPPNSTDVNERNSKKPEEGRETAGNRVEEQRRSAEERKCFFLLP